MSPGTWEAIRGGGVLAAQDGQVVYRVNRRSSEWLKQASAIGAALVLSLSHPGSRPFESG
jgi:hypothetical protein